MQRFGVRVPVGAPDMTNADLVVCIFICAFALHRVTMIYIIFERKPTLNYSDEDVRRIIIKQRRKKRRRKRIVTRLIFLFIIIMVFLICHSLISGKKDTVTAKTRGTIFIDPGHGGGDPGAEANGREEKNDTLSLAKAVKTQLEKKNFKVVMSRTTDKAVDRDKRGEMANNCKADLMISIHRNQSNDTSGKGVEIWIKSTNPASEKLLAENIMKKIEKVGISQNRGVSSGTLVDPTDDYLENSVPTMPSCLIEFGFVSNKKDNKLFDKNKVAYAKAVADGIEKTYAKLYENDDN